MSSDDVVGMPETDGAGSDQASPVDPAAAVDIASHDSTAAGMPPAVVLTAEPRSALVSVDRSAWGRPRSLLDVAGEIAASMARLTMIALFAVTFLLQPFQIPSSSMEKTLLVGDFVLVNKQVFAPAGRWRWLLPYREPRHDELVVFHYPVNPGELLVKRLIALPDDRLHLLNDHVFLNGQQLDEPFAIYGPAGRSSFRDRFPNLQEADPGAEAAWWTELRQRMNAGDLLVPNGRYFAMGDNRNNSQDSRFWGFVPRESIIGEPLLVYLSVDRTKGGLRRDRMLRVLR